VGRVRTQECGHDGQLWPRFGAAPGHRGIQQALRHQGQRRPLQGRRTDVARRVHGCHAGRYRAAMLPWPRTSPAGP
jgi:hypothetical protein